jgi:hypothetical protein
MFFGCWVGCWLCCVVRAFGRSEKSFVLAVLLYLASDWRDLSAIARDDKAYLAHVGWGAQTTPRL